MVTNNATNTSNPITVPQGGTGVATMTTAYAPVCAGTTATGNLQVASTGLSTSGYVFTSNGASALPSFQAATGGGSLTLIQTQTASSSASLAFTTGITSTYTTYIVITTNIKPATNNVDFIMQYSTDGGSTYATTGYYSGLMNNQIGGSSSIGSANSSTSIKMATAMSNSSAQKGTMWFQLANISGTTNSSALGQTFYVAWVGSDAYYYQVTGGDIGNAAAINAFKFLMSSGNIASGVISIYGVSK